MQSLLKADTRTFKRSIHQILMSSIVVGIISSLALPAQSASFYSKPFFKPPSERLGTLYLEHPSQPLSSNVISLIFQSVQNELFLPVSSVTITHAQSGYWSDSCLGIYYSETGCLRSLYYGWRVVVSNQQKSWIYHTSTDRVVLVEEIILKRPAKTSEFNSVAGLLGCCLLISSRIKRKALRG